jgi:uncharacterized SAM-binding protein YcdF (DUF218 family)
MVDTLLRTALSFIEPLSLVWLLLTVICSRIAWRGQWRTIRLPALAWLILTITLCTGLPSTLMRHLESPWLNVKMDSLPTADAVICLGGGVEPSSQEMSGIHLKDAGDRMLTAVLLFRNAKAPNLVFGGGAIRTAGQTYSEGDTVRDWAIKNESPAAPTQIHSLGVCGDTHDEAVKTAALAKQNGWKTILLVTSAYHMTRAKATFEKAGLTVIAAPCNFTSHRLHSGSGPWLHLPGVSGPVIMSYWFHEQIGNLVYRWRGWL